MASSLGSTVGLWRPVARGERAAACYTRCCAPTPRVQRAGQVRWPQHCCEVRGTFGAAWLLGCRSPARPQPDRDPIGQRAVVRQHGDATGAQRAASDSTGRHEGINPSTPPRARPRPRSYVATAPSTRTSTTRTRSTALARRSRCPTAADGDRRADLDSARPPLRGISSGHPRHTPEHQLARASTTWRCSRRTAGRSAAA